MSDSTRSSRADRVLHSFVDVARLGVTLLAVALSGAAVAAMAGDRSMHVPPLPPTVAALTPSLRALGGGEMTFFGLSIYNAWYWVDGPGWPADRAYALDIHYRRNLDGVLIAQRSVDEIEKLGCGTAEQRRRWGEAMARIFPNVRKGDRITGVHLTPGTVRYYLNGAPIGDIADDEFSQAFFGIWLDPKTSRPEFRKKLLGEEP
ncbi:MAG: hypothetical protein GZ089_03345 [Aromatoleum sp.]|nr:hypothetical protein [Aromatoleum sp.]